jgi:hypothetical protein
MSIRIPNPFYSSQYTDSLCLYEKDGSRQIRVVELPKRKNAFYIVDFKSFLLKHGEQMSLNIPKVL